uniref:hypothetical protein n=1 Tax=Verrucomicrobium spinosum TaxID=2736 RepID=UPI000ABA1381
AEVTRVCQQLKATLGGQDERPVSGSWRLHIGEDAPVVNVNVTGALPWNATAEQVRAAIAQLTTLVPTYGACTVEQVDGSYLIRWASHNAIVPLVVHSNQLWPVSFVRVRETQLGGIWVHEVRLVRAPLAGVSTFAEVVPGAPEITALTDGGVNGTVEWGEVQKLVVPPAFRGVYCIKRGFSKTANLSMEDGPDEIAEALEPLADEDGEWVVTNPTPNAAHIEFAGSMVGVDQPLLEVEVFDAPPGDLKFRLALGTAEMDAFLRRSATGEETLPFEIELLLEDENDEELLDRITFRMDLTVQRETTWDELSQPAGIDWLRPPQPRSYVPFTPDQVAVGILHWGTTLGDGVATVFVLDHNLGSESVVVMVRENTSPGAVLRGADYKVDVTNPNSLTVTVLGDYADPVPTVGALAVTVMAMGQASAFNAHTHTVGQIVGLQTILDDLGARLQALEDLIPTGAVVADPVAAQGVISSWDLPKIGEVYPVRSLNLPVPATGLAGFNQALLPRVGGLLAAVHDAVVESLTVPLVAISDSLKGKVFKNESAGTVLLPGGMGRKSVQLRLVSMRPVTGACGIAWSGSDRKRAGTPRTMRGSCSGSRSTKSSSA